MILPCVRMTGNAALGVSTSALACRAIAALHERRVGALFVAQAVADAGFVFDEGGFIGGFDLAAELADIDAQIARVLDVGRAPDGVQQLALGHDLAGVLHEDAQKIVFFRRQMNRRCAAPDAFTPALQVFLSLNGKVSALSSLGRQE